MIRGIRTVTFDAGGTLLFPHPSVGTVYAEVMQRHGLRLDAHSLDQAFRRVWTQTQRAPGGRVSEAGERAWWSEIVQKTLEGLGEPDDFDALFDDLWFSFAEPHRWRLADGTVPLLRTLRQRGYRLGVLSNWDGRLRRILAGNDLLPWFEHVIISAEVGVEKPHRDIFELTRRAFGCAADTLLHVGDSALHDAHGATQAGWRCALVGDEAPLPSTSTLHLPSLALLESWLPALPGRPDIDATDSTPIPSNPGGSTCSRPRSVVF